jgi:DNA-binding SARP family transcriptional activator/tetratricopeptide (TPR) repeat protein
MSSGLMPDEANRGPVWVRLLGPVDLVLDGAVRPLAGTRRKSVLAVLGLHPGQVVSTDRLIHLVWGERPPATAVKSLHNHVSYLRLAFGDQRGIAAARGGFVLDLPGEKTDVGVAEAVIRSANSTGDHADSISRLGRALSLWRGSALSDVTSGGWLGQQADRLEQLRVDGQQSLLEARLAAGGDGQLVSELEQLTVQHPFREQLHRLLMVALYRSGRQADALAAYQRLWRRLRDELGIEPTPDLRDLEARILQQDPSLLSPPTVVAVRSLEEQSGLDRSPELVETHQVHQRVLAHDSGPAPDQLPADTRYFVGREPELARLTEVPEGTHTVVLSALDGMAGIGKTALAVRAAHRLARTGRYPDGVLFLDLHGHADRPPTEPADALEVLLGGLGVPGPQVPPGLDARIGLYRTVLARRRVLLVLDNAFDAAQVRPLLPGGPGCLVLVTGRRRLAGLDEAEHLSLGPLPVAEAVQLFRAVVGPDRDPGDDGTVKQIVAACGLLPLAIRIAAARLRTSRSWTGPALLARLHAARDRVGELDDGDRSVRGALTLSYQRLPADQRRAILLLAVHPGVDVEPYACAALLGCPADRARPLLAALEEVNLLEPATAGRHRFHDLVRAYASELARALPARERGTALDRLRELYEHTAAHAAGLAYPFDGAGAAARADGPPLTDPAGAVGWLDAERANLVATATAASAPPAHVIRQSTALHRHLRVRGDYGPARHLHDRALSAAEATDDPSAQAGALNKLGALDYLADRYHAAAEHHTLALALARAAGDRGAEVTALTGLGDVDYMRGRYETALEHHTAALALARATGDTRGELSALTGLGDIHYMRGRYDAAAGYYTLALSQASASGNRAAELAVLNGLALVHDARGEHGPAAACHTKALRTARAAGNPAGVVNALNGLGRIDRALGRHAAAERNHARALAAARFTGNASGELSALNGLGHVHHAHDRWAEAADCYRQVLHTGRRLGSRNWQFEGHLGLGRAHQATGHPERAVLDHRHALRLARDLAQPDDQARAHDGLAHAYRALGQPDRARTHWERALDILAELAVPAADDVTAEAIRGHLAVLAA